MNNDNIELCHLLLDICGIAVDVLIPTWYLWYVW
jgi:hypothetical protein